MRKILDKIAAAINQNGTLFTIFAAVFVVFVGVAIVDQKTNWWVISLILIGIFAGVFIFFNARVFIKIVLAICSTLMLSTFAFQLGTTYDPANSAGFIWMFQILFSYFTILSLSYLFQSYKGRWGVSFIGVLIGFVTTSAFMIATAPSFAAIIIGTGTAILYFICSYILGVRVTKGYIAFNRKRAMPEIARSDKTLEALQEVIEKESMVSEDTTGGILRVVTFGDTLTAKQAEKVAQKRRQAAIRSLEKDGIPVNDRKIESRIEGDTSSILAYGDYAYALRPVDMGTYFMEKGKRNPRLTYRGRKIDRWLLSLTINEIPKWKTGTSPIMLVLLDLNNSNGGSTKVIGVPLPDSNKRVAMAIIPAKGIHSNDGRYEASRRILAEIGKLNKYHYELTDEEKETLGYIGLTDEEYAAATNLDELKEKDSTEGKKKRNLRNKKRSNNRKSNQEETLADRLETVISESAAEAVDDTAGANTASEEVEEVKS